MPRIDVDIEEIAAGQGHNAAIAVDLDGTAGVVRGAASAIASGAGHPGAAAAGTDWGAAWEGELSARAELVRRTAANLAAAADAYRETDEGQMLR